MRAKLGEDHPDTISSINNLGSILSERGKLEEAEELLREAVKAMRAKLGEDHPHTIRSVSNLGNVLHDRGRLEEAEELKREALQAMRAKLGEDHPDTISSINSLGSILSARGKLEEAEELFGEALQAMRAKLGEDHRDTLLSVHNLARCLQGQGRWQEAEDLHRQALQGMRLKLGEDHPRTWLCFSKLAGVLALRGRLGERFRDPMNAKDAAKSLDEARRHFDHALESMAAGYANQDHPHLLDCRFELAKFLAEHNLLEQAEALLRRVVSGMEQQFGRAHPKTQRCISDLTLILHEQGKHDEADRWDESEAEAEVTEAKTEDTDDGAQVGAESMENLLPFQLGPDSVADTRRLEEWFETALDLVPVCLASTDELSKSEAQTFSKSEVASEGDVSWALLQALAISGASERRSQSSTSDTGSAREAPQALAFSSQT